LFQGQKFPVQNVFLEKFTAFMLYGHIKKKKKKEIALLKRKKIGTLLIMKY
jgi:hypothetical protein